MVKLEGMGSPKGDGEDTAKHFSQLPNTSTIPNPNNS